MELSEIRKRIDSIDDDIRELLLKRIDISKDVALSKMNSEDKTIYREDRERAILDDMTRGLGEEDSLIIRDLFRRIMADSRTIQYKMLSRNMDNLLDNVYIIDYDDFSFDTAICQGIEGAYSHIAATQLPAKNIVFKDSFKEVFHAISGQNYGILPLDNSIQGMVSEVYDLLLVHGFFIVKSIDLEVDHVAMARKGHGKIKYVTAHPQALAQCSKYIEKNGLSKISATNNAVAARSVASSDRDDVCSLGDRRNAEIYGLEIIDEGVSDSPLNTTRFIVVADKMLVPKTGGRVSIVFSLDNKSGTLANVLDIIASYGVSLSKIESRPIIDDRWEYRFYADLEGNIRDKDMVALLYELKSELPFIKILGSYDEA